MFGKLGKMGKTDRQIILSKFDLTNFSLLAKNAWQGLRSIKSSEFDSLGSLK